MDSRRRLRWGTSISISPISRDQTQHTKQHNSWNSYNHYSCDPYESIIKSNAEALVDLGLDALGYRYVTTDCGWGVAERLDNGSLTWNATRFPSGLPALGEYIHELGLLFGVYEDGGILMCGSPPDNVGSLCELAMGWDIVWFGMLMVQTTKRMMRGLLQLGGRIR
jgi:alpha-galactosidase